MFDRGQIILDINILDNLTGLGVHSGNCDIRVVITILYHKVDECLSLAFTPKEKMAARLAASVALWFKVIVIPVSPF